VFGRSFYNQSTGGTGSNSSIPVIDLLSGFLGIPGSGVTGAHGTVTAAQLNTAAGTAGINSLLADQTTQSNANSNRPRAFVNVIFFDACPGA
jgi:anaerobic selenocysteine-containing dehydrogenase